VIDPAKLAAGGKVVFGATVKLVNVDTDEEVTYQVVGMDEADVKQGRVSFRAPLARAMIGREAGDQVRGAGAGAASRPMKSWPSITSERPPALHAP